MTVSTLIRSVARDARQALRVLRRNPAYSLLAISTLAVGIGANTAVFSVVDAVLVRPLPYPDSARLVRVTGLGTRVPGRPVNLSVTDFVDIARDVRTFEALGAYSSSIGSVTVADVDGADRVRAVLVSAGLFRALRTQPAYGRVTRDEDDRSGANVVVISNGYWRRHFGGDPAAVGRKIRFAQVDFEVIGVLPVDFRYPQPDVLGDPDIYGPIAIGASGSRSTRTVRAVGRLKDSASLAEAQADTSRVAADLERRFPDEDSNTGVTLTPLLTAVVGNVAPALWLGLGFAFCVMTIGGFNVSTLSLAKNLARGQEMAVRTALGADRGRLMQQVLTESVVLGALGGCAGTLVGFVLLRSLVSLAHDSLPRAEDIHLDWRALACAAGLSLAAGLIGGLASAFQGVRTGIESTLRRTGRGGGSEVSPVGRRLLISTESMLSAVLLIGAGLAGRSFWNLLHVDPGFSPEHTLTAQVALPLGRYPAGTWARFYDDLTSRAAQVPGVQGAAVTNILPLSGNHSCDAVRIEAHPSPTGREPCAETRIVSANYFAVMRIPVLSGRAFADADREGARGVVMVNEAMAKRFWPDHDPLGERVTLVGFGPAETPRQVVGLVRDTIHLSLSEAAVPQVYVPQHQPPGSQLMTLVVRTNRPVTMIAAALRQQLGQLDPQVPLYNVRTLDQLLSTSVSVPRLQTILVAVGASVAWILTLIGLYGVLSQTVSQRVREIGVRLCLGAQRRDVARLIVGQVMASALVGIATGTVAAGVLVRWSASRVYGLSESDAATFVVVPLVLALAALMTTYLPLRRALAVAPAVALKGD
jgi:putative ABC transport system permease protein